MPLRPPRTFQTARTLLRPLQVDDARAIFEGYSSSPVATRFMDFRRHLQLSEAIEFATRCARCWEDGSAYPWAVISMRDGAFMGVVELRVNGSAVDFGYIFAQQHWGRGIATEA